MTACFRRQRRSFLFAVGNRPCDLEGNVDCFAKKREQQHDLFERHEASPLSAFASGEAKSFSSPLARSRKELDHRLCNQRPYRRSGTYSISQNPHICNENSRLRACTRCREFCFFCPPVLHPNVNLHKTVPGSLAGVFAKF